jgi:two-component system, NtrC family, response regulator AtoC
VPPNEDSTNSNVAPAVSVFPRLIAIWPDGSTARDVPGFGPLVIGRSSQADVRIDHVSVSRRHAKIHTSPVLAVEDLGSSNGTRLGGKKLAPHVVKPWLAGVLLEVGLATCFVQQPIEREVPSSRGSRHARITSEEMRAIARLVDVVAPTRLSVILYGETGVGKEVLAERIHALSPRASRPLVRLNCAALPDALLESELFGFERGAFTGAVQTKVGLLESADGGTLLLDEVGEMPLGMQVKLLRVLESQEVQRLGATRGRSLDVRILAATHRDLAERISQGAFRADLYYRLNGVTLAIPPLRERVREIIPLARSFVESACKDFGQPTVSITRSARDALEQYAWPGNVRELKNLVSRAALFAGTGPLDVAHFEPAPWSVRGQCSNPPSAPRPGPKHGNLRAAMNDLERGRIVSALDETGGNQTRAAKLLGISRRTLLDRLDAYGLPRPQKPDRR